MKPLDIWEARRDTRSKHILHQVWSRLQEKSLTLTYQKSAWNSQSGYLNVMKAGVLNARPLVYTMNYIRPHSQSISRFTRGAQSHLYSKSTCLADQSLSELTICLPPSALPACCSDSSIPCSKLQRWDLTHNYTGAKGLRVLKSRAVTIKPTDAPLVKLSYI